MLHGVLQDPLSKKIHYEAENDLQFLILLTGITGMHHQARL